MHVLGKLNDDIYRLKTKFKDYKNEHWTASYLYVIN